MDYLLDCGASSRFMKRKRRLKEHLGPVDPSHSLAGGTAAAPSPGPERETAIGCAKLSRAAADPTASGLEASTAARGAAGGSGGDGASRSPSLPSAPRSGSEPASHGASTTAQAQAHGGAEAGAGAGAGAGALQRAGRTIASDGGVGGYSETPKTPGHSKTEPDDGSLRPAEGTPMPS